MKVLELPAWAETSKLNFAYAPRELKAYAREVLRMSPRHYSFIRAAGGEVEYVVWNSRRMARVADTELAYYWTYR